MSMRQRPSGLTIVGMATRRKHLRPKPIQGKIPSRFEKVTKERIERNRRGRALCEAAIKKRGKET
jgi:hypothetical protein